MSMSMWTSGTALSNQNFDGTNRFGDYEGGNYAEFDANGFLRFYGDGRAWIDYNFGVGNLGRGASAPDLIQLNSTDIYVLGFDGVNTMEQVFFSVEMNHNWSEGSLVAYPHVHWYPTSAAAGNVEWFMELSLVHDVDGAIAGASSTTPSIVDATDEVAWEYHLALFPQLNIPASYTIGSQLFGRLYRNPSGDNDTYGADAAVSTVGLHVLVDTLGSRQVGVK